MKKLSFFVVTRTLLAVLGCTDNSGKTETEAENKYADLMLM